MSETKSTPEEIATLLGGIKERAEKAEGEEAYPWDTKLSQLDVPALVAAFELVFNDDDASFTDATLARIAAILKGQPK